MEDFNNPPPLPMPTPIPEKSHFLPEVILVIILILVLAGDIYFGYKYYAINSQLQKITATATANGKIIDFEKLFVSKVLQAQGETSPEDRLKLETAAVATQDKDLLDAWHNFLASKTETEAQQDVLILLNLFANKITY